MKTIKLVVESLAEVRKRMYSVIMRILNSNRGKRIAVFSHATAIAFLLKQWCNIEISKGKINVNLMEKDSLTYF